MEEALDLSFDRLLMMMYCSVTSVITAESKAYIHIIIIIIFFFFILRSSLEI